MKNNITPNILAKKESRISWIQESLSEVLWIGLVALLIICVICFVFITILVTM